MGVPNMQGKLSEDEVEVAQVYCVLVLKKLPSQSEDAEEGEDLNETLGKLPRDISEFDIVNLLK